MSRIGLIVGSSSLSWSHPWTECGNRSTEFGQASTEVMRTSVAGHDVFAITRHGVPHRFAPHAVNYRANLKLLASHQVDAIVALNTVGGISAAAGTGKILIPDQIIDYTWGRVQSFSADDAVRHIEFSQPYDAVLRTQLLQAGINAGIDPRDGGTMGVTQGPRLETAAEISRMALDGCAVVGMTGMPEAGLARELGISFASVCLVVNPAAGVSSDQIDMAAIAEVGRIGMAQIGELLLRFFDDLPAA